MGHYWFMCQIRRTFSLCRSHVCRSVCVCMCVCSLHKSLCIFSGPFQRGRENSKGGQTQRECHERGCLRGSKGRLSVSVSVSLSVPTTSRKHPTESETNRGSATITSITLICINLLILFLFFLWGATLRGYCKHWRLESAGGDRGCSVPGLPLGMYRCIANQ